MGAKECFYHTVGMRVKWIDEYKNNLAQSPIRCCFASFPTISPWIVLQERLSSIVLDNGLSDETELTAFLDLSITFYCESSICAWHLSVNPPPLLIFYYKKHILLSLCTPGSVSEQGMNCPHEIFHLVVLETLTWTPVCLFLQLLFSATACSFLSSTRPYLTAPYLSFYPGPLLA